MNRNKLKKIVEKIFIKKGLNSNDSKISANALINAELVGASSHGLSRLKMYCDRIDKNLINKKPKIIVNKISNSITFIDADHSIGFVGAQLGIDHAIKSAKKSGLGFIGVSRSGHYGLSGYYAEQASNKGLIALCFTNAPPAIAPFGAKKTLFGTNPICFSAPTGTKVPFVLDTSMALINRGKIREAIKLGEKIPFGVALDKNGKPTTSPVEALMGMQLPLAGFRGSGLAWMVDILSGVITGSNHGGKVKDPFDDFSGPQNIGHLFFVFKPNLFINNYYSRIKENIKIIKNLPKAKGIKEIYYPGEKKFKRLKQNLKKNIFINKNIKKEIYNLLKE